MVEPPVIVTSVATAPPAAVSSAAPVADVPGAAPPPLEPLFSRLIEMLFIDCQPSTEFVDGNELIAVAKENLAAGGIADYRTIDYGKGGGFLAIEVGRVLDSMTTLPFVRLDTRLQEYGAVAHEFIVRAKVVVR
jgi:hypothetical protein